MKKKLSLKEFSVPVSIEHVWEGSKSRWAFFYVNGHPWLASEEDA